ncbi:MAG: ribosome small subunit-dependent GTPase A [Chromatiales bacterium]|nr:ribosome small subunit-dependent GTPase A [Chromatiales bacterium]
MVVRHGSQAIVETENGERLDCLLRRSSDDLVAGDRVECRVTGDGTAVIERLLPRNNLLERITASGRSRPLAANLTQLVIVVAVEPATPLSLIDRYLVAAENQRLRAVIVLNKSDLPKAGEVADTLAGYPEIGYELIRVSVPERLGWNTLLDSLHAQVSAFVGVSGVGKSSIVAELLGDDSIRTGAVSQATGIGRHTTTETVRYRLEPQDGALIDSPGVRSFRLGTLERSEVARGFREFRPFLGRCRFRDCRHLEEPGCAVREAAEEGQITRQRLESFWQIAAELAP